nr:hypothetical protein [Tanacetum cinerariifolium]
MNFGSTSNSQSPFPKRAPRKRAAKKQRREVPDAGVSFRWQPNEKTLLAKCYVAISEDRNVGRSQANDTFWYRVLNEFNRLNFQKRTNDMLSSKWNTLNHNCQKFNAIYKRCSRLTKSGESELDVIKQARWLIVTRIKIACLLKNMLGIFCVSIRNRTHLPPTPVDLTEDEEIHAVNTDELFGPDARPRPPGKQRPGKKNPIHRGFVVVGFSVDGFTIMDELVGEGEWWCSGGVVVELVDEWSL